MPGVLASATGEDSPDAGVSVQSSGGVQSCPGAGDSTSVEGSGVSVEAVMSGLMLDRALYKHLSDAGFDRLQALILKYSAVFAFSDDVIGCVPVHKGVFHFIPTGTADPITQKPYKLSHSESLWLKVELQRLLRLGVIRKSNSAWMSPVVLVKKPSGGLRLCVDMRLLNAATLPDPYPLPTVEQVHGDMGGCKLYSQMDYVTGFWQVPIHPGDCHKAGFTTPWGNFEFTRMVMGMQSAPSTFQRMMDEVLADLPGARTYIDDTFAFTKEFEQHMYVLEQIFIRCLDYNLKMNPLKCRFCVESVVCLGHLVSAQGVRCVEDKLAAILDLPRPQSAKAMKRFIGMIGHYSRYIQGFAALCAPLHFMCRKNVPFVWSTEAIAAFDALKRALCSAPCLALPNWDAPFILTTDWSRVAIGAVLAQENPDTQEEHPIAFASRLLTAAERNYAATEGECLAVKWAVDKFRYYLFGHRFLLRTDHKALEWLSTARFTNSKLERWAMQLQEFDFSVEYIKGESNVVADYLSRPDCVQVESEEGRKSQVSLGALVCCAAAWPSQAQKQSDLDTVVCDVCADPGGYDNMAICSGCERCFHLRCVMPPMSTVPSGDWLCASCDRWYDNLTELCDPNTVLQYRSNDPYCDELLLSFVESGWNEDFLEGVADKQVRSIVHRASALQLHPTLAGWLLVCKPFKDSYRWLTCPPVEFRWDIIRVMHDALGHAGVNQTVEYMQQHFHWAGLRQDVSVYVKQCDACQRRKLVMPQPPPLQQPVIRGPFEHVHIDLAGPFKTPLVDIYGKIEMPKKPAKAWVVLMIDYFTKAAEFGVIYEKTPAAVARVFYYSWICRYFVPSHVTSDNGTEFETEFVHLLSRLGIKHIHTSACHPAANGVVERLVGTFKSMLEKHVNAHPSHWLQSVPVIRQQYWCRLHKTLGMSPQEMVYGRKPLPIVPLCRELLSVAGAMVVADPSEFECAAPAYYVSDLQQQSACMQQSVLSGIKQQFDRNAAAWPRRGDFSKRPASPGFQVGDYVLEVVSGPVGSFAEGVKGPWIVKEIRGNGTVVLSTGKTDFKDVILFTRHVANLVKYHTRWSLQGR